MKTFWGVMALVLAAAPAVWGQEGVTPSQITLGSVLALKGPAQGLGSGMKAGMEAAFHGVKVNGRAIALHAANDFYEPEKAAEETRRLLKEGVFVMIGNVGTPTAAATTPLLKEANVPAVGFFTGAGLLRPGAGGPIVNYRASYVQEVLTVINGAVQAGMPISGACAFVQNDSYGMAGLAGVKRAFEQNGGDAEVIKSLGEMIALPGDNPARNDRGPVGTYPRNSIEVKPGYQSLKAWEKKSGHRCQLVVTVGAYGPIAHFARVSRQDKEKWAISAVSFTGADNLLADLTKYNARERFVMTRWCRSWPPSSPLSPRRARSWARSSGM
jgi:hypothetical protein